jgi:hypothetical protein
MLLAAVIYYSTWVPSAGFFHILLASTSHIHIYTPTLHHLLYLHPKSQLTYNLYRTMERDLAVMKIVATAPSGFHFSPFLFWHRHSFLVINLHFISFHVRRLARPLRRNKKMAEFTKKGDALKRPGQVKLWGNNNTWMLARRRKCNPNGCSDCDNDPNDGSDF